MLDVILKWFCRLGFHQWYPGWTRFETFHNGNWRFERELECSCCHKTKKEYWI